MIVELFDTFGRAIIFKQWRNPLRQYLLKAGYDEVPYGLFGILFIGILVLTALLFLGLLVPVLAAPEFDNPLVRSAASLFFFIIVPFALISLVMLGVYFVLNLRIYKRVKEMEQMLPEYLQLVVTNLKSGMNFEQSLWSAARPEFGILSREIALVSKKVITGNDTGEAIEEFVERYDSPTLRRNFNLIISEIQSGGEIVHVIERVIHSLKKTKDLKDELSASVLNYMIFIAVIVIVLAPVLFALANVLLGVVISFAGLIGKNVGTAGNAIGAGGAIVEKMTGLEKNGPAIQATFLRFCYWALGLIAFFASLIVATIEKGDFRGGIKYVPLFTVTSLLLFQIFLFILAKVFGGIVG
jgi:pilus assembly protein TadC